MVETGVVRLEPGDGREVHEVEARLHQPGVAAKAAPVSCRQGPRRVPAIGGQTPLRVEINSAPSQG